VAPATGVAGAVVVRRGDLLGDVRALSAWLVGFAAELDATDDVVAAAAGTVLGLPLAVDELAGDGDRAALAGLLAAEGGDVAEQRRLVVLVVDGET
jgi:hypothetical protein